MSEPSGKQRIPLDTLRDEIAQALAAAVKSYNLPSVCLGLGLVTGDTSEAHSSKRVYVKNRLMSHMEPELLQIAKRVVEQFDVPALADLVSEITTHAEYRVTPLTRRAVLKSFNSLDSLFGEIDLFESLEVIAPPWHKPSESGGFLDTLKEDVDQHYIRNPEDWNHFDLLEKCGALKCSQARFFGLIEKTLDPIVRNAEEQTQIAETLNGLLKPDGFRVTVVKQISGRPVYGVERIASGVAGSAKNLIFASIGEKPELIFRDAINNDVEIRKHADKCLIYDRPLLSGLKWVTMAAWWQQREGLPDLAAARKALGERLMRSVELTTSPGEYSIFRTYYEAFAQKLGDDLPALIPQVYLHYDPLTARQRGDEKVLERQRMDFLLLLDGNIRVVIEVDGKQHYAEGEKASPRLYAALVAEDRRLRLAGYELYRFGASEFEDAMLDDDRYTVGPLTRRLVTEFFEKLFTRHGIVKV